MLSRVHLRRKKDVSGVSGVGECVAAGVVFDDGSVVIKWNSSHSSLGVYSSVEDLMWVHGHKQGGENTTELIYDDPPPNPNKAN